SLISIPIMPIVRTSPSSVHVSTPGIHSARPPNSRNNFHASSGLQLMSVSALPLAITWLLRCAVLGSAASAPLGGSFCRCGRILPRARRGEHPAVPAIASAKNRARIVLPHPAGKVAPRPRCEVGGADRGACAERIPENALERSREPEIAPERA